MTTNNMLGSTSTEVVQLDLKALRLGISHTFSLDEIKVACFDLGIKYESLNGSTLEVKVIEMIEYAMRHGMMQELVAYVQNVRPSLKLLQKAQTMTAGLVTAEERAKHRRALRDDRRDINVVHTLRPSPGRDGWYDILIYLVAHKEARLDMVSFTEFFLGKAWNNRVFRADNQDGFVGISISAYGPVLCTCRVVFQDNHETLLERYIDFEMAGLLKRATDRGSVKP
jgi:hypothetical protein